MLLFFYLIRLKIGKHLRKNQYLTKCFFSQKPLKSLTFHYVWLNLDFGRTGVSIIELFCIQYFFLGRGVFLGGIHRSATLPKVKDGSEIK